MNGKKKGFTLIELLVVVLIIGILAAIALPQYQKAVLKSRYTTLMPIAKGIAEGNEAYFMEHGTYAEDPTELPIKGQENYPDGTELRVVDDTDKDVSYVIATRPKLMPNNKYIVFQNHSGKFAGVTLCEATSDPLATWLCKDALKGQILPGKTLSGEGWTGYALSGNTSGSSFATGMERVVEGLIAQNSNYEVASIDEENGKVTVCDTSVATVSNGQCISTTQATCNYMKGICSNPYEIVYDEDGEKLSEKGCSTSNYNVCRGAWLTTYSPEGGYTTRYLSCSSEGVTPDGNCAGGTNFSDRGYDSYGNMIFERLNGGADTTSPVYNVGYEYDNSYDSNGQLSYIMTQCEGYVGSQCTGEPVNWGARKPVYENGVYKGYTFISDMAGDFEEYRYDENGNQIGGSIYCGQNVDWANARCLP